MGSPAFEAPARPERLAYGAPMRRRLAFLATITLILAACGDDESAGGEDAYIDALTEDLQDTGDAGFSLSDDDAGCVAERFLEVVGGAEALDAEGITPDELAESESPADVGLELDEEDGEAFGGAFVECELPLTDLVVDSIESEGEEVSDDLRACIDENFDEAEFGRIIGRGFATGDDFTADPQSVQFLTDLFAACPELRDLGT